MEQGGGSGWKKIYTYIKDSFKFTDRDDYWGADTLSDLTYQGVYDELRSRKPPALMFIVGGKISRTPTIDTNLATFGMSSNYQTYTSLTGFYFSNTYEEHECIVTSSWNSFREYTYDYRFNPSGQAAGEHISFLAHCDNSYIENTVRLDIYRTRILINGYILGAVSGFNYNLYLQNFKFEIYSLL